MNDNRELFSDYSPEIQSKFTPFIIEAKEFVTRNQGKIATLFTSPSEMETYVGELAALGRTLVSNLRAIDLDFYSLYKLGLKPSRTVSPAVEGPGMVTHGDTRYNILEKVNFQQEDIGVQARTLLVMIQNLPAGINTGDEIHGIELKSNQLVATRKNGGMELHIPLRDDTVFYNNGQEYKPKALEGILTLPGDIHSLQRQAKPAVNIIVMAFGAGLGVKVNGSQIANGILVSELVTQTIPLQTYTEIPRQINL